MPTNDMADDDAVLEVVGEAPAGGAYSGSIGPGQTVRIFTGGPVPEGADTVLMQENTSIPREGRILVHDRGLAKGRHIRKAGTDFSKGDTLLTAGTRLDERHLSLAAAGNVPRLIVYRRPRMVSAASLRDREASRARGHRSSPTLALCGLEVGGRAEPAPVESINRARYSSPIFYLT